MGCYPLFCCENWSELPRDLEALADELLSIALVTDPFGDYSQSQLEQYFNARVIPEHRQRKSPSLEKIHF